MAGKNTSGFSYLFCLFKLLRCVLGFAPPRPLCPWNHFSLRQCKPFPHYQRIFLFILLVQALALCSRVCPSPAIVSLESFLTAPVQAIPK
ncbi:hypothetical protein V5799_006646 [Amblyomma americanum]|uniref:Secreted protein n=1 Tax=Amblyomma americanum TaxID=6943 RepID=A0AAQ4DVT3_AMBAM